MGTIEYCILILVLMAGLMALSIAHDEKRRCDRRKQNLGPPNGIERRSGKDRRGNSLTAYVLWILRSRWHRIKTFFKGARPR
jgi:hypothetical protein